METINNAGVVMSEGLIRALQFAVPVPETKVLVPTIVGDTGAWTSTKKMWVWGGGIGAIILAGIYFFWPGKKEGYQAQEANPDSSLKSTSNQPQDLNPAKELNSDLASRQTASDDNDSVDMFIAKKALYKY